MTDFRVNGIVIKETDFGEYDKLLTILTEKDGKLFVVVKGVKSVRSRHMATTQLFSYSSFNLRKRGNYYYITDSDLIENYFDIRNDMLKVSLATFVCDVISHIAREEIEEAGLLKLVLNTLFAIAKNIRSLEIIRAAFELRVALECGFMPDLTMCNTCYEVNPEYIYIDIMDGIFTCDKCHSKASSFANAEDPFLNAGISKPIAAVSFSVLTAMRYVLFSKPERFLAFNLDPTEQPSFFNVCEKYLLNHLEKGFYSLDFYKSLL